jgi:hypothetical protein
MTLSTVALQSDRDTRLISANGTLVNLLFAAVFWLLLLRPRRYRPATHYFLVLAMAGNLLTGTGYFLFSGVFNFGDWAAVIRGLQPHWMWQAGLVLLGVITYWASMMAIAAKLKPFRAASGDSRRLLRLCWTPYVTDGILAGVGGLLNPLGFFYVLASALPSTLGANAGLLSLPSIMQWRQIGTEEPVGPLPRSPLWIALGLVASAIFIFVLGRGLTFSR